MVWCIQSVIYDASKKVISFSDGHAHNFFIMVAGKVEFECEAFVERTTTLRILVRCITDWVFFIQLMCIHILLSRSNNPQTV